jgi:hypothetical protein
MDKKQAIELVVGVCANYKGTFQEHQVIQEAIRTLSEEEKKE